MWWYAPIIPNPESQGDRDRWIRISGPAKLSKTRSYLKKYKIKGPRVWNKR
jgi:hypothetical protein